MTENQSKMGTEERGDGKEVYSMGGDEKGDRIEEDMKACCQSTYDRMGDRKSTKSFARRKYD